MTRAIVLDLAGLAALDDLTGLPADRVVVPFQTSPARREDLARRWPGVPIVHVPPSAEGPWQARVSEDLGRLAEARVEVRGVPVLDCFRAVWREELTLWRALQHGLEGARRATVVGGGVAAALLRSVAARGGLSDVAEVEGRKAAAPRPGLLARLRRAGTRGTALALATRLDPSGLRRAALRSVRPLGPARGLAVSSYVNATRAAFEAVEILSALPAVHVRSGPGALRGAAPPDGVRSVPLAAAIARDRGAAREAVAQATAGVRDALRRLASEDAWDPWADGVSTGFRRALLPALVPEVAAAVVGLHAVAAETAPEHVVVGDEFSFVDRAALHVGRARGIPTTSRQHGVLDSHYRRDPVLADAHLAWDDATVGWLAEHGATGPGHPARAAARRVPAARRPAPRGRDVVVFLQPLHLATVPTADWLAETFPPLLRASRTLPGRVLVKPHPLQTRAEVEEAMPADLRAAVAVVTDVPARDLLATCAAAVTLDSSVAVDCRDLGVPCFSTAWYEGTYARDLARLGWVVACATPDALEAAVRGALRAGGPP